ncbi:MAG: EVE domain-containing protein [Acidobacteriia bacterium]|jgi:predicted RNA-binding protein with PUA-like domain|nr:EVE domain-containing protein [Terriglobia bacterium]
MAFWLLKTEPSDYAYSDLVREKKTVWDGVSNNLALKYIRQMRKGDLALIYHTGNEKAVVGIAVLISDPYPDPEQNDPRLVVVDVKPKKKLVREISLAEVKSNSKLKDFELVRLPRLSVMPVETKIWKELVQEN